MQSLFLKILNVLIAFVAIFLILPTFAKGQNIFSLEQSLRDGVLNPYLAPPIARGVGWINSKPLALRHLRGKVILIHFWTYSCADCLRTLPHLKTWYKKYHDKGLVIISVHAPEFESEKNVVNVKNAVIHHQMTWPIVLDNRLLTWQNYNNRYRPAHYLIDQNGYVVYQHFGEGNYALTEQNIRTLLGVRDKIG